MSTKPTKAGKTIRNNTNHQVLSILCEPGTVPCQLPNPVTNLSCWVSSICMPKSSLYSSPSCSLLRSHDLYWTAAKGSLAQGHRQERGGRRQGWGTYFPGVCLLLTAGWLCPSAQSLSSRQAVLPVQLLSLSPGIALCTQRLHAS